MTIAPDQHWKADASLGACASFGAHRLTTADQSYSAVMHPAFLLPAGHQRQLGGPALARPFIPCGGPGRSAFNRCSGLRRLNFERSNQVSRQASPDLLPVIHLSIRSSVGFQHPHNGADRFADEQKAFASGVKID